MQHPSQTFTTVINCIDGRTQKPVTDYMKKTFGKNFVDTITYPGVDKVLGENYHEIVEQLKEEVEVSVSAHGSEVIAIAGHHFCAGNPVSKRNHRQNIKDAVELVKSWNLPVTTIIGLYVNKDWEVEKVV